MNWTSVERLFAAAIDTTPADRPALLDAEVDEVVRAEVRRLLAEHDALSSGHDAFLGTLDLDLAATLIDAGDPRDPVVVGRYEIVRRLGAGATGVVYLARDPPLGRHVALKLLAPYLSQDANGIRRFTDEARTTSRLDHPHIVAIHEIGRSDDDRLFIVMAHHEGGTLRDRIAQGPLPVPDAVRIASEVADGLSAAHAAGVVHRDIKPENILVTARGACIVDFGIAKVTGETVTRTGAALGTAAYMSPEQTRGPAVDHRSDLWSLGVVLYEMLTGERPFRADGGEALVYGIRHDAAEPVQARRRDLGLGVARVVERLLEKEPRRRYQSAAAVVSALREASPSSDGAELRRGDRAPPSRRLTMPIATGVLLLILGALAAYYARRPMPARFERNLIAIAPFDVPDSSLQLWREGLVDILSLDLDGAGPLRTVPQSVVVGRWSGRADRASAAKLGRRTGAELVVFGHVVRRGTDSVGLRVTVLDRSSNTTTRDLAVVGQEGRMGQLADSLGLEILRVLGRGRPIGAVREVTIGARSLPALKEFLRGEQFYRRGHWDSALAHYDQAVAQDADFALALRRMVRVIDWTPLTRGSYQPAAEYLRRAVALNRGLPPRDSLLLLADSFKLAAAAANPGALIRDVHGTLEVLEEAARRYPADPEIWFELGEARYHWAPLVGVPPKRALEALDHAIRLDPGFSPAYEHTVELALHARRSVSASEYARTGAALASGYQAAPLAMAALVLDSGAGSPAVTRALSAASANTLLRTGMEQLTWATDSGEAAVAVLRALVMGGHDEREGGIMATDPYLRGLQLGWALAFRGRLREATDFGAPARVRFARTAALRDPFMELALFGVVADSLTRRVFNSALAPDADWGWPPDHVPPRYLRGAPWWLARRDTAALRRFAARAALAARVPGPPVAELRGRYLYATATAYFALARGDSLAAAELLQAIPDSLCLVTLCFHEKVTLARLLVAVGADSQAASLFDRWGGTAGSTPSAVLAALERARVAERLSDTATARDRYQFVAEAWRNADAGLQVYVAEARAAGARLGASP